MTIRRAAAADLEAIARIQAESPEAAQWAPESYLEYTTFVAVQAGGCATGLIVTRPVAAGEFEILNLAVAGAWRRRGIAGALVDAALTANPGVYFLEVRESNRVARAFYAARGFAEAGRRPAYYKDPEEGAIVMRNCSCYCHSAVGRR